MGGGGARQRGEHRTKGQRRSWSEDSAEGRGQVLLDLLGPASWEGGAVVLLDKRPCSPVTDNCREDVAASLHNLVVVLYR